MGEQQIKVVSGGALQLYTVIVLTNDGKACWAEVKTHPAGDHVWTSDLYPTQEEAMGAGVQYAQDLEKGQP